MAILNSITIGKGRKSLGNVTLQTLGGVVVAKQKIMRNTSKSAKQQKQRQIFKKIMNVLRKFATLARLSFTRVKTASAYARWAKAFYAAAKTFTIDELQTKTPLELASKKFADEGDFNVVEGNKVFSSAEVEVNPLEPTEIRTIFACSASLPGNKPINVGDDIVIEVAYCNNAEGVMTFVEYEPEVRESPNTSYDDTQFIVHNGIWEVRIPGNWSGEAATAYPIITVNNERIGLPFSLVADPT